MYSKTPQRREQIGRFEDHIRRKARKALRMKALQQSAFTK